MFQEHIYSNRINNLKKKIKPGTFYFFSNPSQISYLTGFNFMLHSEREAFFVCSDKVSALIYTSFSPVKNFSFLENIPGIFPNQLKQHFEKLVLDTGIKKLFYDNKTLFVAELNAIEEISELKTAPITDNPLVNIMSKKEPEEIDFIKKACQITHTTFEVVKSKIKVGITELEISQQIKTEFEKNNIYELAFPTIVAFGENAAKPHHQPSDKTLEENTVILIDMGAKLNDYCADMTRTFWFGENKSDEFKKIEKIVLDAYNLAFQECKKHSNQAVQAQSIDSAARAHISNHGFAEKFIHTTGHGLGLEIHESPSINWNNHDNIFPGMTITIEPGIYIEGDIGYRYENTILVTIDGAEVLTQ
jgi:Xaa-Pro aminopeptidase